MYDVQFLWSSVLYKETGDKGSFPYNNLECTISETYMYFTLDGHLTKKEFMDTIFPEILKESNLRKLNFLNKLLKMAQYNSGDIEITYDDEVTRIFIDYPTKIPPIYDPDKLFLFKINLKYETGKEYFLAVDRKGNKYIYITNLCR